MKKSYFYKLKEKFRIKKIDSEQPSGTWMFVIILNIVGLLGFLVYKKDVLQWRILDLQENKI